MKLFTRCWFAAIAFVAVPWQEAAASLIVDQIFTYGEIYGYTPLSGYIDQGYKDYSNSDFVSGNPLNYGSGSGHGTGSANTVGVYAEAISNGNVLTDFSTAFGVAALLFHSTIDTPYTLTSTAIYVDPPSSFYDYPSSLVGFSNSLQIPGVYIHNTGGTLTWSGMLVANAEYDLYVNASNLRYGANYGGGIAIADSSLVLTTPSSVPEPSSLAIMGLGGLASAIGVYCRRRNKLRFVNPAGRAISVRRSFRDRGGFWQSWTGLPRMCDADGRGRCRRIRYVKIIRERSNPGTGRRKP
jgi:hypothetical protein